MKISRPELQKLSLPAQFIKRFHARSVDSMAVQRKVRFSTMPQILLTKCLLTCENVPALASLVPTKSKFPARRPE
jgi:hypothetical protein